MRRLTSQHFFRLVAYQSCAELLKVGYNKSGVYLIKPSRSEFFSVYCDQTSREGGDENAFYNFVNYMIMLCRAQAEPTALVASNNNFLVSIFASKGGGGREGGGGVGLLRPRVRLFKRELNPSLRLNRLNLRLTTPRDKQCVKFNAHRFVG